MINLRAISWLKSAKRDFEDFPPEVRIDAATALSIAARGGKADTAKPFKGVDGGVFEIALKHRGNAYRVIYFQGVALLIFQGVMGQVLVIRSRCASTSSWHTPAGAPPRLISTGRPPASGIRVGSTMGDRIPKLMIGRAICSISIIVFK
jgi:hypothetical protein